MSAYPESAGHLPVAQCGHPYTYLVDVLQRVSPHPERDVEALTPRRWKAQLADNPLKSDLAELGK